MVKNLLAMQEAQLNPLMGKIPGEGNDYPLQHSCLENPTDRGAWRAMGSMGSRTVEPD